VFVKADAAPGGDGSKAAPFASIEEANAVPGNIYVCLEPLTQPQVIVNPATIYGGVDCTNFTWTAAERSQIATCQPGTAGCASDITIPLTIEEVGTVTLVRIDVFAPSAIVAGQSSIGIRSLEATVILRECDVVAGNGAPGAMGLNGTMGEAGGNGANGSDFTSAFAVYGPAGGLSTCGVAGGQGGGHAIINMFQLANPDPGEVAQGNAGLNGTIGSPTVACAGGGQGVTLGVAGLAGIDATGLGAITSAGYTGVPGGQGGLGSPGGGGGGGGSLRWIQAGPDTTATGGSGGAGGCGGLGGLGGGFGGSSFAILSLGTTFVFDDVSLQSAMGADGALGGAGGPGGSGGAGGTGGYNFDGGINPATACSGGAGRPGGVGGAGGAGSGGHSAAIAHLGPAPNLAGTTTSVGTAGIGPGSASDGVAAPTLAF
jgi:hypothetical protein